MKRAKYRLKIYKCTWSKIGSVLASIRHTRNKWHHHRVPRPLNRLKQVHFPRTLLPFHFRAWQTWIAKDKKCHRMQRKVQLDAKALAMARGKWLRFISQIGWEQTGCWQGCLSVRIQRWPSQKTSSLKWWWHDKVCHWLWDSFLSFPTIENVGYC